MTLAYLNLMIRRMYCDVCDDGSAALDPNHGYFVMVNGNDWGDETGLRVALEKHYTNEVPMILVVVNGGDNTLFTVLRAVRLGMPVIVVKGSGRVADEIAHRKLVLDVGLMTMSS